MKNVLENLSLEQEAFEWWRCSSEVFMNMGVSTMACAKVAFVLRLLLVCRTGSGCIRRFSLAIITNRVIEMPHSKI